MAVIATGFFDGVHSGHRLVVDTLVSLARKRGEESVIVTFWPHPRAVLQSGADTLRYLTPVAEKTAMLRSMGVDRVETVPFTRSFASMSAGDYIDMLRTRFGCTELVLGYDTRFGCEQAGPEEIVAIARGRGLEAVIVPPFLVAGIPASVISTGAQRSGEIPTPVSSTRIRAALEAGDVALAARLLGRPYSLHGVVVSGNKLGRTIGFPTANMRLYEPLMAIPKTGVYATSVILNGAQRSEESATLRGMTNIGTRPTVSDRDALTIETHIFDFDEMIYGLDITVKFLNRIRDERKFSSLEELKSQLASDAALIRA